MRLSYSTVYDEDLAYIQHHGFASFAEGAAPGLLAMLHDAGIERGATVVDLGCGSGIWLRALTDAGYEALGVDLSPALAAIARRTAPKATVHTGSAFDHALEPCDAVTALGEVLGYLPPGGGRPPSLRALFRTIHAALPQGGLLVFDLLVATPRHSLDRRRWWAGDDWVTLTDVQEDERRGRLVRDIVTFRRQGQAWRRRTERHVLRVARREDVEADLRSCGFTVRALRAYGAMPMLPRRMAFRARKT